MARFEAKIIKQKQRRPAGIVQLRGSTHVGGNSYDLRYIKLLTKLVLEFYSDEYILACVYMLVCPQGLITNRMFYHLSYN